MNSPLFYFIRFWMINVDRYSLTCDRKNSSIFMKNVCFVKDLVFEKELNKQKLSGGLGLFAATRNIPIEP